MYTLDYDDKKYISYEPLPRCHTPDSKDEKNEENVPLGPPSRGNITNHDMRLIMNVRIYVLADKFAIDDLKTLSKDRFEKISFHHLLSVDSIQVPPGRHRRSAIQCTKGRYWFISGRRGALLAICGRHH